MTTVRQIIASYLLVGGFDGLAGDECGCDKTDLFPCDACPDQCVPGYRWECETCPEAKRDDCEHVYGGSGCYRTTKQETP